MALLGSTCPTALKAANRAQAAARSVAARVVRHGLALGQRRPGEWSQYLRERAAERRADRERERQNPLRQRLGEITVEAFKRYDPKPGKFPLHIMLPNDDPDSLCEDRPLDWGLFVEEFTVSLGAPGGDTNTMLLEPHVANVASSLKEKLENLGSAGRSEELAGSHL